MKKLFFTALRTILLLMVTLMMASCKKNGHDETEKYRDALSNLAEQYECPKQWDNGTTLKSVTFEEDRMVFRLEISDNAIAQFDRDKLDKTRDSLILHISDRLKGYLVEGDCKLVYKYIAPNDSVSIEVIPSELENSGE